MMNQLNISVGENIGDHETMDSLEELYETFIHFFSKGAPAERFMADDASFEKLVRLTENKDQKVHVSKGYP